MPRTFNITGPCESERHYMLPAEARLPDLLPFVDEQLYFVVHAARQTGKTTAMRSFAARLRERGVVATWATLETSQERSEVADAEPGWLRAIAQAARFSLPEAQRPPDPEPWLSQEPGTRLLRWLEAWAARVGPASLVLLLDEADLVRGPALVSLLRQLRAGFMDRGPGRFPTSVALVGMRDLRDYLTEAKDGTPLNPGSPFNIKGASLTLRAFTSAEVAELYAQHSAETGQDFSEDAVQRAFWWTRGQPFLVNALARICVMELVPDPRQAIDAAAIDAARERLVRSRTTHLDSLAERLKEPRVARVVQPMLLGDAPFTVPYESDDFDYCVDLGLVVRGPQGAEPANPLYREVLTRQLGFRLQAATPAPWWPWRTADGRLDFPALVDAFMQWWRENADAIHAHGNRNYPEALAHLAFMAFLQRVVNEGGSVIREYAAGRGAVDLVVTYGPDRFVVELKRVVDGGKSAERVRSDGVAQLGRYLDAVGAREGWLIVFDQRAGRSWEDRLWAEDVEVDGRVLRLRGA